MAGPGRPTPRSVASAYEQVLVQRTASGSYRTSRRTAGDRHGGDHGVAHAGCTRQAAVAKSEVGATPERGDAVLISGAWFGGLVPEPALVAEQPCAVVPRERRGRRS